MVMDSDIDIARAANPKHIEAVAKQLGLSRSDLIMHGSNVAKISWNYLENKTNTTYEITKLDVNIFNSSSYSTLVGNTSINNLEFFRK